MFTKIRTTFSHVQTTSKTYTPEDLNTIGQTLNASRRRLAEIRQLPIEDIDRLYRETMTTTT